MSKPFFSSSAQPSTVILSLITSLHCSPLHSLLPIPLTARPLLIYSSPPLPPVPSPPPGFNSSIAQSPQGAESTNQNRGVGGWGELHVEPWRGEPAGSGFTEACDECFTEAHRRRSMLKRFLGICVTFSHVFCCLFFTFAARICPHKPCSHPPICSFCIAHSFHSATSLHLSLLQLFSVWKLIE